jgi:hypothetical protein
MNVQIAKKMNLQDKWSTQGLNATMKNVWNKNLQSHAPKLLDLQWTLHARDYKNMHKEIEMTKA